MHAIQGEPCIFQSRGLMLCCTQDFGVYKYHRASIMVDNNVNVKKSIIWYSANIRLSIRVSDFDQILMRSILMRLYSPVDLTGNANMTEKFVLGGTGTGVHPILRTNACAVKTRGVKWANALSLVIRTVDTDVLVLCSAKYHIRYEKRLRELWILFGTGKYIRHISMHQTSVLTNAHLSLDLITIILLNRIVRRQLKQIASKALVATNTVLWKSMFWRVTPAFIDIVRE